MKLAIRKLDIAFGDRPIVQIGELNCEAGEIVGLVGESGSGKSMTATAVLGLAERLGGKELIGASERTLRSVRGRRVAMIFQSPGSAFNPLMRVGSVFDRTLRLHGVPSRAASRKRAELALEEVLLPAIALNRYPHQLSGGQLQRVAIALALALDAEVLLADEPTSALDVTVQAEILTLLTKLRTRGLAILLITHDLGVVSQVADRVAVMQSGKLVEVGLTRTVLAHPQHLYTRTLLSAVPRMRSNIAQGGSSASSF
jgi:ABC-type glutathione transport system ATPase component